MIDISKKSIIIIGILVLLSIFIALPLIACKKDNAQSIAITNNIVFLGDSITESFDFEKYLPDHPIINSGVWGDKTDNAFQRLKSDVLDYHPKKVFILLGINDMGYDRTNEDISNRIANIIVEIQAESPQTKIYLISVYPLNTSDFTTWYNPMNEGTNDAIDDLNKLLIKLSKNMDVEYIDVAKYLKNENNELKKEYTVEGVHLTDEAYEKISEVLDEYLE